MTVSRVNQFRDTRNYTKQIDRTEEGVVSCHLSFATWAASKESSPSLCFLDLRVGLAGLGPGTFVIFIFLAGGGPFRFGDTLPLPFHAAGVALGAMDTGLLPSS
jgi:hypothetical protein